jgi:hypothetical protein
MTREARALVLNLAGLPFIAHSPSLFELVSNRKDKMFIIFGDCGLCPTKPLGEAGWALVYCAEDGHTVSRTFKTRDDAARIISARRAQA